MEKTEIAKIILVDREPKKLTAEELDRYTSEYMTYCKNIYDWVSANTGISDKDARNAIFERMLSPFQYFLEDKVRMERYATQGAPPAYPNRR